MSRPVIALCLWAAPKHEQHPSQDKEQSGAQKLVCSADKGSTRLVYTPELCFGAAITQLVVEKWGQEPYFGTILIEAQHFQGFPVFYNFADLVS